MNNLLGYFMNQVTNKNRNSLLLSAQRALLGAITPKIRAIYLRGFEDEGNLKGFALRVYFESVPTEEEQEILRIATTEIVSDFPQPLMCDEEFLVLPPPNIWITEENEIPIYIRYEPFE